MPRKTITSALLLCCMVLTACRDSMQTSRITVAPLTGLPLSLLDHLDAARVDGAASRLLETQGEVEPEVVIEVDFETGVLAPLVPFGGIGTPTDDLAELVQVTGGARAHEGTKSARLRGGVPHGVSLRTPLLPVRPSDSYVLRYRISTEEVELAEVQRPLDRVHVGEASVVFYRIDPADDPAAVLADPAREVAARVSPSEEPRFPSHPPSSPWQSGRAIFHPPARATHMRVSFDLGRPEDDRSPFYAHGTMWLDDVVLLRRPTPPVERHRVSERGLAAHGLTLAPTLAHPAHEHATERRYALAAPAPSSLAFPLALPEGRAVLSIGFGLLPAAWRPGGEGVVFEVAVGDAQGTRTLHTETLLPETKMSWRDVTIDLSAYAGRRIELDLRTRGRAPSGDAEDLLRLPEAGAVWSHPVVHDPERAGRLVALVVADTLAAGHSSTYGYERPTTPQLSRIARDGVLFRRALANAPWTLPSIASIFTGLDPLQHRAGQVAPRERDWRRPLAEGLVTLAEVLRAEGYETRGWGNNPYLVPRFGLAQGFSSWVDYGTGSVENAAEPGVSDLLRVLAEPRGHPRMVFFHLMDPHGPYRPNPGFQRRFASEPYEGPYQEPLNSTRFGRLATREVVPPEADRRRVRHLYDGVVAYTDHQIGRIYDAVREAGRSAFVFVATADHGEELWEREYFEHGHSLYEEQLRVPLVVVRSDGLYAGSVREDAVALRDVAATLLQAAHVDPPREVGGGSLLSLDGRPSPPRDVLATNLLYGSDRLGLERTGVRYLYNHQMGRTVPRAPRPPARHELYRLARDPGETENRFEEELALGLELHEELARRLVGSLAGEYVVVLDGGGGTHLFEGSLTLPPGAAWQAAIRDFVWPAVDGSAPPLRLRRSWRMGRSSVDFRVRASRALLVLPTGSEVGGLDVSFRVDGETDGARVLLGASSTPTSGRPGRVEAASLWLDAGQLLGGPGPVPAIRFGRARTDPVFAEPEGGPGLSRQVREQLRELGYIE